MRLRAALAVTALNAAPSSLTATLTKPFLGYEVRWTDGATVEVGYELQRTVGGGAWSTLALLPQDERLAGSIKRLYNNTTRIAFRRPARETCVGCEQIPEPRSVDR